MQKSKPSTSVKKLFRDKKGQGLVEYLILVFIIGTASIAIAQGLGKTMRKKFQQVKNDIRAKITLEASQGSSSD